MIPESKLDPVESLPEHLGSDRSIATAAVGWQRMALPPVTVASCLFDLVQLQKWRGLGDLVALEV